MPLRSINRLEEGDTLLYRPLLRSGEERKGEVAMVLVPADKSTDEGSMIFLQPKLARSPQEWKVPIRTAVVAYVYGPAGLSRKKVKEFLSRDDELVAQLADYAEKTAQTEALIAALSSPNNSAATVHSALQGFSSQYGIGLQIDKTAPTDQQAMVLLRALNPAMATYDPISSPQRTQQIGQTASMATLVAALFFGSPVGLAAGGTAMLLQLHSVAYPNAEFRSSFAQILPNEALGLCGRRDPSPPHTRVAYLWASRVPNLGPPQLTIDKANFLPADMKSPLPVAAGDSDWKYVDRARGWTLVPDSGKPIPIKVQKLANKELELDLPLNVKAGKYRLSAHWDWDTFMVKGIVEVRSLEDFQSTRLLASSQDLLVGKTGKVPVILEGSDFEYITKVEMERVDDKFASPVSVPFVLPEGLRRGPQTRMDIQVNTTDLDAGSYKLLITQVDGKPHQVPFKILPPPPRIENFPVVLNQGAESRDFILRGQRLDRLTRLEVAKGAVQLGPVANDGTERKLQLRLSPDLAAGTSLALKAYLYDRSSPLIFADAVRVVGPRPQVTGLTISPPPQQDVQIGKSELPGGVYLSAMLHVAQLQSNSSLKLGCEQPGASVVTLKLGERSGPFSLQQLAPGQVFLSFDTGAWLNGCRLQVVVANGSEGESDAYPMGRIVRVPRIAKFELTPTDSLSQVSLTGQNLEVIEKAGWAADRPVAVSELPVPVPGEAQTQTLHFALPLAPQGPAQLYIWLRGEAEPRLANLHLDVSSPAR